MSQKLIPLSSESLSRGAVAAVGGPLGRFARIPRSSWWSPLRVVITLAWTFLACGFLSKATCAGSRTADDGTISLNWDGNRQYTSFCYNDIVPLYGGRGLDLSLIHI